MKVIEAESAWDFWDLLDDQARRIVDTYDKKHYTNPEQVIKDRLIDFLKRLPNGNYTKIIKEYWK